MTRPVVLLATCAAMPDGEEWAGTNLLLPALAAHGVEGRWEVWDDPGVDWSEGLVAVRSTWDYEKRLPEFLDWTRSIPRMLNSAAAFAWNTDKAYLLDLAAAGLEVVPTVSADTVEERRRGRRARSGRPSSSRAWVREAAASSWSATTVSRTTSAGAPGWCSRSSSRCARRARRRST